jgi:putative ABC transport system permease protein
VNPRILLRHRLRDWRTSLAFLIVAGSALAVAGAWFSIAHPLLRDELPFPDPASLAAIESSSAGQRGGLSWMTTEDLRAVPAIESIAAFSSRTWGLQTEPGGHVEVVLSRQVTGEFFRTLGVEPQFGQPLTRAHEQTGDQNHVWFSHRAWQRILGGQRPLDGRIVWINAAPYRVDGVLPPSFDFPHEGQSPEIYIPLPRTDYWNTRGAGGLGVIARLRSGVSFAQFQSQLDSHGIALESSFPASNRGLVFRASALTGFLLGGRIAMLGWLAAAVAVLILVAMANAADIWLARWLHQQRHASIRLSLGASMARVWREQAAEVLILGAAAWAAGTLGAMALLRVLSASPALAPEFERMAIWRLPSIDWPTMAALAAVSLAVSAAAASLPLIATRGRRTSRSSGRLRLALAVAQLTLTGSLGYTGILAGRNVYQLGNAERGFRTGQILVAGIGIPESRYNSDEKMIRFHQRAIDELKRIPGVTAAAGGISLPVSSARTRFLLDDETTPRDRQRFARFGAASPELLSLLGIPLRRGRAFTAADQWNTRRVALVNQAFANRYLASPIGHRLRISFYNGFAARPYTEYEIVGIAGDTRNRDLATESEPQILISAGQMAFEGFFYFLESSLPAHALREAVAEAIWRVDPQLQRVGVTPLVDRLNESLAGRRRLFWILALFAALAVLVVTFGLASSLLATFAEIAHDLGIRSALGASRARLQAESVRPAVVAVCLSLPLMLPVTALEWDPLSYGLSALVLCAIAMAAGWSPARRAAALDPAAVLRRDG